MVTELPQYPRWACNGFRRLCYDEVDAVLA